MTEALDLDVDPRLFRRVMGCFTTGVTVITVGDGDEIRGMTANAFMSGSLEPPLCIVSIAKRARLHGMMMTGEHFGVSVLAETQIDISEHFAGRPNPIVTVAFERFEGGRGVRREPAGEMIADVLLPLRQDADAEALRADQQSMHVRPLRHRDDAERRLQRARHEGVRRHAADLAAVRGGNHRHAGGETPHGAAEEKRVGLVSRSVVHRLNIGSSHG